MFCTTLHRRKSFSSVIPALTANPGLNLRENRLSTHDLALPLPRQGNADTARTLRVLLLSPTCTTPSALLTTLSRIQHFSALNGSIDSIIVFLLNPDTPTSTHSTATNQPGQQQPPTNGLHAHAHLSATLLTDPALSSIPILPLPSTTSLPQLLKTYIRANSAGRAARLVQERKTAAAAAEAADAPSSSSSAFNTAFDLLPWCTADATAGVPLGRDALFRLTDLFGSLREVAAVAVAHERGDEGVRGKVREMVWLLGEQTARDVLDFWVDEWVVD